MQSSRRYAVIVAAILALPVSAQAQSPDSAAAAETLFKAARELVDAGKWAEGCPKFDAALALHASASTQINIARCHEHEGRTATAWAAYKRALVLNRETLGDERQRALEELAKTALAALEPNLSKLVVRADNAPPGLVVTRDGLRLPAGTLGLSLPVDPGEHRIVAHAPGFIELTRVVSVAPGKLVELNLALARAPRAPPAPATHGSARAERDHVEPEQTEAVPTWAWVSGASGVVLLGAGVFFLVDDLDAIGRLRDNCSESGGQTRCAPGYDYAADNSRKNRDFPLFLAFSLAGSAAVTASVIGIVGAGGRKSAGRTPVPSAWATASAAGLGISGGF